MLQNAYLLAKIGADTAENERNFAEILPKIGNYPTGPLPPDRGSPGLRLSRRASFGGVLPINDAFLVRRVENATNKLVHVVFSYNKCILRSREVRVQMYVYIVLRP